MRIVDRKSFLSLPAGTVYSKYAPCYFEGLAIKCCNPEDGWTHDFLYDELIAPVDACGTDEFFRMCDAAENGQSIPLTFTENTSRDGLFEEDQMFAVFERQDVEALIVRLKSSLKEQSS